MYEERSGWVTFAAVLFLIGGTLNVIYGIAAIGDSRFFVGDARYIVSDLNTWGWIALGVGLLQVLGAGSLWRGGLFGRIMGLAAASIFTFVLSWNEVFAATILTVSNRTLPAQVFTSLGDSPLPFRFAGGFALIVPSLVFIFFIRRYLLNMWGRVVR